MNGSTIVLIVFYIILFASIAVLWQPGSGAENERQKCHPELVQPALARKAITQTNQRTAVYSHYIIAHYRATGNLVPGCDFRDLLAWYELNMPAELAAITMKARTK